MARRVEEEERTRRDAPKFLLHKPIHPTPHHLLFRYMERKTGGEGPARSCRCIFFFFFFFFNVLSGDYNTALADIYIFTSLGASSVQPLYIIPSSPLSVFTFYFFSWWLESSGLAPIRYPIHCLFLLSGNPSTLCDPPCTHAYHSLFVLAIVSAAPSLYANVTPFAPLPGK